MKGLVVGLLLVLVTGLVGTAQYTLMQSPSCTTGDDCDLVLMTWNVQFYPEDTEAEKTWFGQVLRELDPDILFIQEIGNEDRVQTFVATEIGYTQYSFTNTSSGMDNAVFFHEDIAVTDLDDPGYDKTSAAGFMNPPQVTHFSFGALSAVLISVHLTWDDNNATGKRTEERQRLIELLDNLRDDGHDSFIVAGDFNTTDAEGDTIEALADALGLHVLEHEDQPNVGTTYDADEVKKYDYFLVSENLRECVIGSCVVTFNDEEMAKGVADHKPVLAYICLNDADADTSTLPPEGEEDQGSRVNTGAVAGGSVGGVVILILVAWMIGKRRRSAR